jgi:hypothetical protein
MVYDWISFAPPTSQIIISAVTIITAWITWRGYASWWGSKDTYETARRLIQASTRVRDAFDRVRKPHDQTPEEPPDLNDDPVEGMRKSFHKELLGVGAAMYELETVASEAEVLWGRRIRVPMKTLRKCSTDLYEAISEYLRIQASQDAPIPPEYRKVLREKVYGSVTRNDPLSQEMERALSAIKEVARPGLGRKH